MKIPTKIFYSTVGYTNPKLGDVLLFRARLLFRLLIWKNRYVMFFRPSFSNAVWHRVPKDSDLVEELIGLDNPYQAMSLIRSHPDYEPPVV